MSVIRVRKRDNPFVQIDRAVFEDERISWKAKGMLGYLLSKPDNWQVYIADLENKSKDGRDAVRSGLKELEETGYIRRTKKRNNKGRFEGWEYEVYETPVFSEIGKTEVGFSDFGLTDPSNKEISNKEVSNKEIDDDKPNPFKEYEQAFGHLPPSILQHEFSQIISGGQFQEPEAILCEVIKRARERMPRNPAKYISSILKNLEYMGLFTMEAVREYNELHDRKTKRVGRVKKSADEVNWEEL
ncbi:DnaD domain protein [Geobacillus thermoleovorans]|nr:DnaD domain protein [Geobacillus thermoleovorans]